jgi:hypothetical protein
LIACHTFAYILTYCLHIAGVQYLRP